MTIKKITSFQNTTLGAPFQRYDISNVLVFGCRVVTAASLLFLLPFDLCLFWKLKTKVLTSPVRKGNALSKKKG